MESYVALKKIIYLFIYLFLTVLGLHCCVGISLVAACVGFSLQWLLLLQSVGSRTHRLQ